MSFTADWLDRREHYDAHSRNPDVIAKLDLATSRRNALSILDLGAGTGSMMRYLAPRLRPPQHWLLVDHDGGLLARAEPPGLAVTSETRVVDLVLDLNDLPWDMVDLVTASALLDLVSGHWLQQLYERCVATDTALYASLNYDGRIIWAPADADDAFVTALFNRHQRTDKGFGSALGPAGSDRAVALFRHADWLLETGPSDWHLKPADDAMQRVLADGIADAAAQIDPGGKARIADWLCRRQDLIGDRRSFLTVGHTDILALPKVTG